MPNAEIKILKRSSGAPGKLRTKEFRCLPSVSTTWAVSRPQSDSTACGNDAHDRGCHVLRVPGPDTRALSTLCIFFLGPLRLSPGPAPAVPHLRGRYPRHGRGGGSDLPEPLMLTATVSSQTRRVLGGKFQL